MANKTIKIMCPKCRKVFQASVSADDAAYASSKMSGEGYKPMSCPYCRAYTKMKRVYR